MQSEYIADLVVLKTKEFKEVKELLISNDIVSNGSEIIAGAETIAEITNALTDLQASKFIDLLIVTPAPSRGTSYSTNRVKKAIDAVDSIKNTISNWSFPK